MRRARFALGSAAAFAGVGLLRYPVQAAQFAWKYGSANTPDHPANAAIAKAFDRIREETSGDLDIKGYYTSSLGNEVAMISQTRLGAIEMLCMNGGTLDSVVPVASIEGIAYAFPDRATIFRAMDGDLGKIIRAEFAKNGFYGAERVFENGLRHITTSAKPVRAAEDLQGMKFRVAAGNLYFDTFKSLGVLPATVTNNELYVALQTHMVDGQETPLATIVNLRLYEVQKYCSLSHHMWAGYWMLFNLDKWNSLPRKFQEIVEKNVDAAALAERSANEALQQSLIERLQGAGLSINGVDVASFKTKLTASGYYGRWKAKYGPAAWTALEKYAGPLG